jgi:hypothetical protein
MTEHGDIIHAIASRRREAAPSLNKMASFRRNIYDPRQRVKGITSIIYLKESLELVDKKAPWEGYQVTNTA